MRYDVDLGISGLDWFGELGWPGSSDDLRLKTGDDVFEAAGEREVGGVYGIRAVVSSEMGVGSEVIGLSLDLVDEVVSRRYTLYAAMSIEGERVE